MYSLQRAYQQVHLQLKQIDCDARDRYLKSVEDSARQAEKNQQHAQAYIQRQRGMNNTSDPDNECT